MQFIGRRVAGWCAVLVMAVALVAIVAGCASTTPEPAILLPAPLVPSVPSPDATPAPTAQTYAAWRAETPRRIATVEEAAAALLRAGMPVREAETLAALSASCEAPAYDVDGTSLGIDLYAVGDQGRAHGAFQVRTDVHTWAARLLLADLDVSAQAAVRVYREAGSLAPWSCK